MGLPNEDSMKSGEVPNEDSMKRGEVPISIESTDLILDILSRSSAKTVARFRRASKFWSSMLFHRFFTDMFHARSPTRPRLLIALEHAGALTFCSSPQLHNPNDTSRLVVAAEFHVGFPADWQLQMCRAPVSGLIYCPNSKPTSERLPMICKPSTGQLVSIPKPRTTKAIVHSFLGFDPVLNQYKVLFMNRDKDVAVKEVQILTLGSGEWKVKNCVPLGQLRHYPLSEGICINGVLYYVARSMATSKVVIVCFDVRAEDKFIMIGEVNGVSIWSKPSVLVNFKGKLGGVQSEWRADYDGRLSLELCLWVLEDVEKKEWSRRVYVLPNLWGNRNVNAAVSIAGVTATGELVFTREYTANPLYVYYYNLDSYTLNRVEIQGISESKLYRVHAFVDHFEDLNFLTES